MEMSEYVYHGYPELLLFKKNISRKIQKHELM